MSSLPSLKTLPYSHRPLLRPPVTSPPSLHLPVTSPPSPLRLPVTSPPSLRPLSSSAAAAAPMTSTSPLIEHVVLFKVRDGTAASDSDAMIGNLASLAALPAVSHLAAAPLLGRRSAAAAGFTHLLHSRYASKDALAAYSADPAHVAAVQGFVLPVCDDILALDWVADGIQGPAALPAGAAARLTLVKPREGKKEELAAAVAEAAERLSAGVRQVSFGENFSPARAKGYGFGLLAVFDGVEALDAVEGDGGVMEGVKEKVRPLLEGVIVVDFVVPARAAASL